MPYINGGSRRRQASCASATSANGVDRTVTSLDLSLAHPGTVSALCVGSITTSSVVATYRWQVSHDNATFYDLKGVNNAANVSTAAGTGSIVAHSFVLAAPDSIVGWEYARLVPTLSGASTNSADVTAATYQYLVCDDIYT